jgi:uncharacterized cofD-like protein
MKDNENLLNLRVVTIGGGTGGFILNRGLHAYPVKQTAICTVFDSGGSTGILRDEFGALPQGDIRRCMLAMAEDKDDTVRRLFNYRFQNGTGSSLSNHSLGNLLLLAAEKEWGHIDGIRRISRLLGVRGQILPISTDDAQLWAELSDGSLIEGESAIDVRPLDDERVVKKIWLKPSAFVRQEAAEAIINAHVVALGPGDLYTSIIPNLLVGGVSEAIARSKARVVYVSNLMTKWSETRDFNAVDFLEILLSYNVGREKVDMVLMNNEPISKELVQLYREKDKSSFINYDETVAKELEVYAHKVVAANFLSTNSLEQKLVRHGPSKLAKCIVDIGATHREEIGG